MNYQTEPSEAFLNIVSLTSFTDEDRKKNSFIHSFKVTQLVIIESGIQFLIYCTKFFTTGLF